MVTVSIVIPVYNEEQTLKQLVEKVIKVDLSQGIEKEVILVNDASNDSSWGIINTLEKLYPNIIKINNEKNSGKTQAVKKGILISSGDYVVIQDADLEYEPNELGELVKLAIENKLDVVYGDRFAKNNKVIYWQNYLGNKLLSFISNIFTYPRIMTWLPDMEVCYKLIRGDVARKLAEGIVSKTNFGFEPEITAKLSRYKVGKSHLKFGVLPISYYPRTIQEGKKMKAFNDGFKALIEVVKFNLF